MNKLEQKIQVQIAKVKEEILQITNEIESHRSESNKDEDVSIASELQDRLEILSEKISLLQSNLAVYQNASKTKNVSVGKTVEISNSRIKSKLVTIVLPGDADSLEGFVSLDSPLGEALLNKRTGEEVVFKTPNGDQKFKIAKIS